MRAHGHFDMWIDHQVLLAHLKGQWNLETRLAYSHKMQELGALFQGQPWAHIVYLDDWELCTPDLEPVINELVAWVIDHGLIRTAQIYSPSMIKQSQIDRMVKEKHGDFERQVFSNEQDGFSWLAEQGFTVEQSILLKHAS